MEPPDQAGGDLERCIRRERNPKASMEPPDQAGGDKQVPQTWSRWPEKLQWSRLTRQAETTSGRSSTGWQEFASMEPPDQAGGDISATRSMPSFSKPASMEPPDQAGGDGSAAGNLGQTRIGFNGAA